MDEMDEFDLIKQLFAPLAISPGAAGLTDDVAELTVADRMIATADAIVEGVHFLPTDPLDTVAAKLMRVNVSDIHAKGAEPLEALLSLVWPKSRTTQDLRAFAIGLDEELRRWGVALVGGDTTSTDGPLVLSLTLTGRCGARGAVRRSGGRAGDDLWVTGVIGDGWLGLQAALGELPKDLKEFALDLADAYRRPRLPGIAAARLVSAHASAAMDVSDGLVADAAKLASASGVCAQIHADQVPLSKAGGRFVGAGGDTALGRLLSGGDDYQILFAANPASCDALIEDAKASRIAIARIGGLVAGKGVQLLRPDGALMQLPKGGWTHFA